MAKRKINKKRISKNFFSKPKCVVKRHGVCHAYDERKVYASCYFACRSCHLSEQESEKICDKISKAANKWVSGRKKVTSQQIFELITKELKRHNKDASFMYETHRDIS